jgi:hypothetical protein
MSAISNENTFGKYEGHYEDGLFEGMGEFTGTWTCHSLRLRFSKSVELLLLTEKFYSCIILCSYYLFRKIN